MTPEKMTNAELADQMDKVGHATHAESIIAGKEAAKRIRAMPEPPTPEFGVGWRGNTRGGNVAEIYGENYGVLYGRIGFACMSWNIDGTGHTNMNEECNLIPNTPELEIMWRDSAGIFYPQSTFLNMQKCGFKDDMQKVEVRVLPCE